MTDNELFQVVNSAIPGGIIDESTLASEVRRVTFLTIKNGHTYQQGLMYALFYVFSYRSSVKKNSSLEEYCQIRLSSPTFKGVLADLVARYPESVELIEQTKELSYKLYMGNK